MLASEQGLRVWRAASFFRSLRKARRFCCASRLKTLMFSTRVFDGALRLGGIPSWRKELSESDGCLGSLDQTTSVVRVFNAPRRHSHGSHD